MEKLNPASTAKTAAERKRIPMSVPVRRLETPEIPGFHLHWFRNTRERLQRAIDAGYEFVDERELRINAVGLGSDTAKSGNTDMGSRVSVTAGGESGADGQAERLVLMKIKQEFYEQDQALVDARNENVAAALRGGLLGSDTAADKGELQHRYVDKARTQIPDLFKPKRAKTL